MLKRCGFLSNVSVSLPHLHVTLRQEVTFLLYMISNQSDLYSEPNSFEKKAGIRVDGHQLGLDFICLRKMMSESKLYQDAGLYGPDVGQPRNHHVDLLDGWEVKGHRTETAHERFLLSTQKNIKCLEKNIYIFFFQWIFFLTWNFALRIFENKTHNKKTFLLYFSLFSGILFTLLLICHELTDSEVFSFLIWSDVLTSLRYQCRQT